MTWSTTAVLTLTLARLSSAQSDEIEANRVRGMWSTEFRNARAEKASRPAAAAIKSAQYKPSLLGLTIWRLRPSLATDPPSVRAIVHEKVNRLHTPVRVSSQSKFAEGDHLRLTIESGSSGYLYVVSRERYRDGSTGLHQLIFPTTRLHSGDNRVRAGFPVEIPSGSDDPSYFTLRRSRPDHMGDEVFLIFAPVPIDGIKAGKDPLDLSESLVKSWQQKWVTKVRSIEFPASQQQPISSAEMRLLRAGSAFQSTDPLPQTLYRVEGQSDQPFLIALQLKMDQ